MNKFTVAKEKRQRIANYLKTAGKPVGKWDIMENAQIAGVFDCIMRKTREEYPQIQKIGDKQQATYIWKEVTPVKVMMPEPEPAKKEVYVNASGYKDTTAGKAIENVMRSRPISDGRYPGNMHFGEFWAVKGKNETDGILVISAKEGKCFGCFAHDYRKGFMKDGYILDWADKSGRHWVCTLGLMNYDTEKMRNKIGELDEEKKSDFRKLLAKTLGYEATTEVKYEDRPVEKIVEVGMKEEEVQRLLDEQEVAYEKKIEQLKTEMEAVKKQREEDMLKQKVSIYEAILFKKGA